MNNKKLGFLIVTHGKMGQELLNVASYIMGQKLDGFQAVEVPFMGEITDSAILESQTPFQERREWLRRQIADAIDRVDSGAGVVILTDIIGGTSFNVASELLRQGQGVIISGVNLPMLLKAAYLKELSLEEATKELVERSRKAIDRRSPQNGDPVSGE